jgi:hypothetical protein
MKLMVLPSGETLGSVTPLFVPAGEVGHACPVAVHQHDRAERLAGGVVELERDHATVR